MESADKARTTLIEQIALGMRETVRWTGRAALSPRVAAAIANVRRDVTACGAVWRLDRNARDGGMAAARARQ